PGAGPAPDRVGVSSQGLVAQTALPAGPGPDLSPLADVHRLRSRGCGAAPAGRRRLRPLAPGDHAPVTPHVVIVGGGFAGLYMARALGRTPVQVTLIDRTNHHLFQPMLYQVATAALSAPDIS